MIKFVNFGQNPSFGSRDSMQKQIFYLTFQSAAVSLKIRSRSSNLINSLPHQQCICAHLVKIHPLVQEIWCGKVFIAYNLVTFNIKSRSQKSNEHFIMSQFLQYINFGQNPLLGSRYSGRKQIFCQNLTFPSAAMTLKIWSRSPKF